MIERCAVAGVALVAASGAALAAPDDPVMPVARVEIVGTLPFADAGIDRDLLPYAVQAVDRAALREAQAVNLTGYMARRLGGVNVNDVSGNAFQTDVTYRGYRASPVLGTAQGLSVYLDGVRVNEPFGDVVNWDMLPESAIGKLTLVSGSNPLYGLNTLGGALALQTRSGQADPGFEGELSTGSGGRARGDFAYGARSADGWHGFAAGTVFRERGWREHSESRLGNLFLKAGHADSTTDWSASLLAGRSRLLGNGLLPSYRYDDDGMSSGLYEQDRRAVYTYPDQTRNRLAQAAFTLSQRIARGARLTASAYLRNSRRDTTSGDISDAYADYVEDCGAGFASASCGLTPEQGAALHPAVLNTTSTSQLGRGASLALHAARGAHVFDTGLTYDRSRVGFEQLEQQAWFNERRGVLADPEEERELAAAVTGTAHAFAVFAADTWTLADSTHLSVSARYNRATVANTLTTEDGPQAPESFSYRKLNPALGITHKAGPFTWYANAAQANRVPTVIELGCADPAAPCRLPAGLQSDPYLKQVVARTLEAGVRGSVGGIETNIDIYRTINRDDILFVKSGTSQAGYFANFDRTRHQGAELGAAASWGDVRWNLDYSYLDATYDAAGTLFMGARTVQVRPGTRIAGLPRHTLKLALDWEAQPGLTFGADLQAVSKLAAQGNEDGLIADPGEGEPRRADWSVAGHALLNLRANWRLAPRWELYARVSNVFDRRYETYGMVAPDLFPGGALLRPHEAPGEAEQARFVAPGAPRLASAGLRYRF